ncbi:hypothetical protein BH09BAC5_BH09BAC5_26520 [soil metagenome]
MKLFKLIFLPLSLLLFPLISLAQDPMLFVYRPHWPLGSGNLHNVVSVSGEYNAGSDALTNSFLNSFFKGDYLDSITKSDQEARLLPSNRIGGYASYSMSYSWRMHPDTGKWEFTVAYRDRQSAYGKFSADAFRLAFEGNRPFKGTTANLDNTHLTYLHWQQLQFEAKYFSPDNRSDAAFGFSVINGQQLQEVSISKASLFTASDGSFVDASSSASYFQSDTTSSKFGSRNGTGSCFNFRFNAYFGDSTKRYYSQLSFMVQDLGFLRWNNSIIYNVDTSLHYTGVDVSDLIVNGGSPTDLPNSDSLIGTPQQGQVISFLPLGIRARYSVFSPGPFWGGIDARIWNYSDAIPQITLFGGWHSSDFKLNANAGASWGGYSRLQFPVQIGYDPCKHFAFILGSTNIAGYIVPKKTHGQGLYLNLSYAF